MKVDRNLIPAGSFSDIIIWAKSGSLGIPVLTLALLIFFSPCSAMASKERYVIDFGDQHIRNHKGEVATILLKKSLKKTYPWLDLEKKEIRRVILVARSKKGRGTVQFRLGKWLTGKYRIKGSSHYYTKKNRSSYDRIVFSHPSGNSRGPWQMYLTGNLLIRKVIVEIEHRKRHHRNRQWSYNW